MGAGGPDPSAGDPGGAGEAGDPGAAGEPSGESPAAGTACLDRGVLDAFVAAQLWDLPAHVHPMAARADNGRMLLGASVAW